MCRPTWTKNWQTKPKIKKHRKANVRTWNSSNATRWSEQYESQAQYNPLLYKSDASVKSIELRCVDHGTPIHRSPVKWTFYLKENNIVGVCCGERTNFVFAEWHSTGIVHGRPISRKALRLLGVRNP
jgi:hypothetical protein